MLYTYGRRAQEVLSLSARLQASNAAALEALGALFPPELFPLPSSESEGGEGGPVPAEQQQGQEQEEPAGASLSVVAEEGEGEEGLSEMVAAVELQLTALDAVAAVYADGDQEASSPVAVEDGVVEEGEGEEGEREGEAEEAAQPEEAEGVAGGQALTTDSPPSMSDLGLSAAFTRRFILEGGAATPGCGGGASSMPDGAAAEAAAKAAAGISPTMSASPASPPLPIEKRAAEARAAAAAAAGLGTPVITMATAEGERAFPSPVFRTGVKVRRVCFVAARGWVDRWIDR